MLRFKELLSKSSRNLSQLSKTTNIDESRLVQAIQGLDDLSVKELAAIAKALNIPISDLVVDPVSTHKASFLFRKKICEGVDELERESLAKYVAYTVELVGTQMEVPRWIGIYRDVFLQEGVHCAERCAQLFRSVLRRPAETPLTDLPEQISQAGAVFLFAINARTIEGASAVAYGHPFVFVSRRFEPRMLFTFAHELGHLVVADPSDIDYVIVEHDTSKNENEGERFANAFAAALLMPRVGVGQVLSSLRTMNKTKDAELSDYEILVLSHIFGVSFEMAALRCESIGLLERGSANALVKHLRDNHKTPEKRANDMGLPQRVPIKFPSASPLLVKAAVRKVRAGEMSLGFAASALGLSVHGFTSPTAE